MVLLASLIAVLAGLMIFPVLAATGIDPASGPGLTFMTMPAVFQQLPFGRGWRWCSSPCWWWQRCRLPSPCWSICNVSSASLGWSRRAACNLITALVMAGGIRSACRSAPGRR